MKLFKFSAAAIGGLLALIVMAQLNYKDAINAVNRTNKTDIEIERTMAAYGYNVKWHEDITLTDKVIALFSDKENRIKEDKIIRMITDERGLTSVVYQQDGQEWALDYLTPAQLDSLKTELQ